MGRLAAQAGLDPLQHGKPLGHPAFENGGGVAAVAALLGSLCQGADLGRALAAHDRPQPDQAARGGTAMVATATMIQGYGDGYRHGVADWNAIIDGLAKPTF